MADYKAKYKPDNVLRLLRDAFGSGITAVADAQKVDRVLDGVISSLPEREKRTLELLYGLLDGTTRTLTRTGEVYDGPERIREVEYRTNLPKDYPLLQEAAGKLGLTPEALTGNEVVLGIQYSKPISRDKIRQWQARALRDLRHKKAILAEIIEPNEAAERDLV